MNSNNAIELKNISFSYDKNNKNVISNLSIGFEYGKTISIMGDNGSGKSTLLQIIAGLLIPDDGNIFVFNKEVNDDNVEELINKNIGMVFQNPDAQFVANIVKDDIAFGLENQRINPKEMDGLILKQAKELNIENLLEKDINSLSGGQKQKVALADILIMNPKIILLDEAVSMLDDKSKNDFYSCLNKIKVTRKDLTIIEVTHDEKEALLSDEVIIMKEGRIIYHNEPKTLFENVELCNSLHIKPLFYKEIEYKLKEKGLDVGLINTKEELLACLKK